MISVPCGTGDIADAMISAPQMIYASRMKERILYHIFTKWKYIIRLAVYHIAIAIYHYLCEFNLMKIIRSLVVCVTHFDYVAKVKKVFRLKLFVFVL